MHIDIRGNAGRRMRCQHSVTTKDINVAGDEVVTIRELVSLMEEAVGREASIQHLNEKGLGNLVGDNTQMKKLLNVLPEVTLRKGLRKMLSSVSNSSC